MILYTILTIIYISVSLYYVTQLKAEYSKHISIVCCILWPVLIPFVMLGILIEKISANMFKKKQ